MQQAGFVIPKFGIEIAWVEEPQQRSLEPLGSGALRRGDPSRRRPASRDGGAFVVRTGVHTGRSPNDKFFVEDAVTQRPHRLGQDQQADLARALPRALQPHDLAYAQRRELFVRDCWAGADPAHRIGVRVITETAWHNLFARNMFLRPPARGARRASSPTSPILQPAGLPGRSEARRHARRIASIAGQLHRPGRDRSAAPGTPARSRSRCSRILNYLLPDKDVLPMHCSANIGPNGDVAIFFGLSRHRQDHAVGRRRRAR